MESTRGQLLIAGPKMVDPNFFRAVILVIEHSEDGALGLVLNHPSESTVGEATPQLTTFADEYDEILVGGPVAQSGVIVLGDFEEPDEAAVIAFGSVGVLSAGESVDGPSAGLRRARVFAGHSGWGPGQLDGELERGDWIIEPASYDDAFTETPDDLWASVLDRKGGSYALVARMPEHPELN
jgi:putative transcriptional regulator